MPENAQRRQHYCCASAIRLVDYNIAASGSKDTTLPEGLADESLRVIVIDGCGDYCGRNKAELCGLIPDCHVVATDCGAVKSGLGEPSCVFSFVWIWNTGSIRVFLTRDLCEKRWWPSSW